MATNKPIDPAKLRKKMLKDFAPSQEQQSMGFVQWENMGDFLGQPFDSTNIPLSKLRQMRRDPMIAFALQFVKLPLVRAPWFIECEEARIAAFVTEALRLIYERLMMQFSLKYDYGFQAIVKNFAQQPVDWTFSDINNTEAKTSPVWTGTTDPILWKPFTTVPPEHVSPEWTSTGDFDGFYRSAQSVQGARLRKADDDGYVDVEHALWVTNEKDSKHGSIWGYPRIGYSYRYWWSYWYAWALRDRWMERTSDPSVVVRYPADVVMDDETGEAVNLRAIAEMLGENVRAGATITLPNDMIRDGEGQPTNMPAWDISFLEQTSNVADTFQQSFDYLDVMKLRSCLVPEQALITASGSQSNRNTAEQFADFFTDSQATEMVEFGDMVNRYMIPQLLAVNFPEYKGKCRWISRGFSSADRTLVLQLLTLVGQKNPEDLDIDVRELLSQLQVPLKSPEQIAQEREENKKMKAEDFELEAKYAALKGHDVTKTDSTGSAKTKTGQKITKGQRGPNNTAGKKTRLEEMDAIPGQRAGIDEHGQYYDPRERIVLSHTDNPFAHKIKDLRYYNGDDDSLEHAQDIYEAWEEAFTAYYKEASKHIVKSFVALSDDTGEFLAKKMESKGLKIFQKALDSTNQLNKKLAAIAAGKEMAELGLEIDWDIEEPDMRDWIRIHGAQLVRNVTESTRRELAKLLAEEISSGRTPEQIAESISEKFSQWPGWKAERIARSEARDAYNAGTLLAARKAGLTKARASDASGGTNLHTDKECIDRNGRVYDISEALDIQDHPNGTLTWDPLRPIEFTEAPEEDDTARLKSAVQRAQNIKWRKQDGKWWATLGHVLASHDAANQPSKTVTARLLYLTEDLEEDIEINLSQETHPFADVTTGPGVINFYDVKRKLGNGSKIPEDLYLSALAEGVLE